MKMRLTNKSMQMILCAIIWQIIPSTSAQVVSFEDSSATTRRNFSDSQLTETRLLQDDEVQNEENDEIGDEEREAMIRNRKK